MGTLFLDSKVEQPYFLKYCKRNPVLTYRHSNDPEDFSLSLLVYRENDQNCIDLYAFQIKKQRYDTTQKGKILTNSDFDFYSLSYADSLENAKSEILELCIDLEGDAVFLRDKIKDDDPDLFSDILYIATLYLKIASRGKEYYEKNAMPEGKAN